VPTGIDDAAKFALLRLHDQQDELVHDLTANDMARSATPPPAEAELRSALGLLVRRGLVTSRTLGGTSRYAISKAGVDLVESNFDIQQRESGGPREYFDTGWRLPQLSDEIPQGRVNWPMWGAILTGVGVLVAIVTLAL
jgi:hypothetical protein